MNELIKLPALDLMLKSEHIALQREFLKLATALGVEITDGMTFPDAFDRCRARAQAASIKADTLDAIVAGLDGAQDAVRYAIPAASGIHRDDLTRAVQQLDRAVPLLRKLAGAK
jgi:hypothetical protein